MNKKLYPCLKKEYALVCRYDESILYPLNEGDGNQYTSPAYEYDTMNQTAAEILMLCDGIHTIESISQELAQRSNETEEYVLILVDDFLRQSLEKGHIVVNSNISNNKINIFGDFTMAVPINACFEITKQCPLKCQHCFNNSGEVKKDEMTTDQIKKVIDKLTGIGIQKLMFTGGEPFARNDFLDIIEYAYSRFMAISIASNGYLITENIAQALSIYKRKIVIQISVDGTEEHHDYIRGVKNSFKKAVKAIMYLRKYNIAVTVAATLNDLNFGDMEQIAEIAYTYGALQLTYAITMNQGRARDNNLAHSVDIRNLVERAIVLKHQYADKGLFVQIDDDTLVKFSENDAGNTCGAGISQIAIRENGNVSPCLCFFFTYGNILRDDPHEIFSPKRAEFFKNLPVPHETYCGDCVEIDNCSHCFARAYDSDKNNCKWKSEFSRLIKNEEIVC